MDYQVLADLLFPNVTKTREELEAEYPARSLPEGAKVTRFAEGLQLPHREVMARTFTPGNGTPMG